MQTSTENEQGISAEQIAQLVTGVWEQVLGLPAVSADHSELISASRRQMAAYVQISGAWDGSVALHCTQDLAARAAAKMFAVPSADISTRDELDALGELANMIGGNFKPFVPGPSHLSLPTVVGGASYAARVPGSKVIGRYCFKSGDLPFEICVLEREQSRITHAVVR